MDTIVIIGAALLGLLIGPLLRRAVDQIPDRRSLFTDERSPLRVAGLLPIVSWFDEEPFGSTSYLVGPDDREGLDEIPTRTSRLRAPLIDISTAVVMGIMGWRFGWSPDSAAFIVLAAAIVVVTVIDIDHYRIPNLVVYPTLAASSLLLVLAALITDTTGGLIAAALGAVAYYGFLFIFWFVYPKGMGFGDVKLALVLGLHAGWAGAISQVGDELVYAGWVHGMRLVLLAALFGSVLGSIIGLGSLAVRQRRGAFPFGPALCLGALIAIAFSEQLL